MNIAFVWPHAAEDIGIYGITEEFYIHHRSFEHNYSKLMMKHGHKPTVIYLSRKKGIKTQRHEFGHKLIAVPIHGPKYFRHLNSAILASTLSEMKEADIIHVFNYYSNFYDTLAPVLRFKNMKFVAQGQAIAPSTFTIDLRKLVALRFADHIMPLNSDDVKRITMKYKISDSKVTLIPNGVDTSFFRPMNKRKARNALGFEEDLLHVLTVARLEHAKGIDILLWAFAKVVQSGLKVSLLVLGDGPERASLESLANALGVRELVSFTGFVPNELTPCYYNAADIFVLPSRDETFGIVLLEAMACGLPVVGSRVGGIKDIIRHGVSGFLFNVEDHEALASALFKLLNDEELRRNLGVRARSIAEKEYDNEKIYLRLLEVYKEVLEHSR